MQIKVILIRMVLYLYSLWNRGTRELENGLLGMCQSVWLFVWLSIGCNTAITELVKQNGQCWHLVCESLYQSLHCLLVNCLLDLPVSVKPGSHMPPTYLGHGLWQGCSICEHLSATHNLSQASRWSMPATDYVSAINVHICCRWLCPRKVGSMWEPGFSLSIRWSTQSLSNYWMQLQSHPSSSTIFSDVTIQTILNVLFEISWRRIISLSRLFYL